MKTSLIALGFASLISANAFAQYENKDVQPVIDALVQGERTIADLQAQLANGNFIVQDGNGDGAVVPTPPVTTPSVGDCTFCDESAVDESPESDAALGELAGASGSFREAGNFFRAYQISSNPSDRNFKFAFGCSHTGDGALKLTIADFTLGYPKNQDLTWRTRVDTQVNLLNKQVAAVGCP